MSSSGIIYLMRNFATANDERNYPLLMGQNLEDALSPRGRRHAEPVAEYLSAKRIAAIYCSPQQRTVQSAYIINEAIGGVPVTFATSLNEVDMGAWEGQDPTLLTRSDADKYAAHLRDPGTYGYPGGENLSQVCRRALGYLEGLAKKHAKQRILVVSHGNTNRAVLAHFCGIPFCRLREVDQDPGCVNLVRVFRGVMELQAVNYTSDFSLAEEEEEQCVSASTTPAISPS